MPIFGLSRTFDVGRGIKVFLNLQTGATRGKTPDPWHRNPSRQLRKKDKQIERGRQRIRNMRSDLKQQNVELFRLRNEIEAINRRTGDDPDLAPTPRASAPSETGALPDFVIVGAQKCGTTRFYNVLTQHPNVEAAAINEVHYFNRAKHFRHGLDWYRQFFLKPGWENGRRSITGEKTPEYLFHPKVPGRMAQVIPEVRLIVLLRNPVDRAYSHYHHVKGGGRETRSFEEALDAEQAWLADRGGDATARKPLPVRGRGVPLGLLARGIYVDQLARWREFFDEEQMLVIRSEDFFERTTEILGETQDFLGLPRHELVAGSSRKAGSRYEPMPPDTRKRLEAFFEPHNRRLYDLLYRDFGW